MANFVSTSPRITWNCWWEVAKLRQFSLIISPARPDCSIPITRLAPRHKASPPMEPLPAQRSNQRQPDNFCCQILNKASRTLAVVGRVNCPARVFMGRLP